MLVISYLVHKIFYRISYHYYIKIIILKSFKIKIIILQIKIHKLLH